ncbi:hypothetical protein AB0B68_22560 [Micromonospora sp. NPDC049049]|uniref:WXG100 family type VII secretion target n=1 Tax=Micromonospora sp. NPDC049049 TaxID=3155495 RepID=UPI0033E14D38
MRPLDVDPAQLREAGEAVRTAADQLGERWQQLRATADGMGDIFGADDVGGLIGVSYQAANQVAERSVTSVLNALSGFADGLVGMGNAYDQVEEDNADLFRALG